MSIATVRRCPRRLLSRSFLLMGLLVHGSAASAVVTISKIAEVAAGGTFFEVSINNQGNVAYRVFVIGVGEVVGYGDGFDPLGVEVVREGDMVQAGVPGFTKSISLLDGVSMNDDDEIAMNIRYTGGSAVVIVKPPYPVSWPPPAAQFVLVADSNNVVVASP